MLVRAGWFFIGAKNLRNLVFFYMKIDLASDFNTDNTKLFFNVIEVTGGHQIPKYVIFDHIHTCTHTKIF